MGKSAPRPEFHQGRDPEAVHFVACTIGNMDGSIDFSVEDVEEAFDTEKEAADHLRELADEWGFEGYVYRCVPVLKVKRSRRIDVTKVRAS